MGLTRSGDVGSSPADLTDTRPAKVKEVFLETEEVPLYVHKPPLESQDPVRHTFTT